MLRLPIRSLCVQNYRSIKQARIEFSPITYLVGPNGAGKSNVIDALQFLQEALVDGLIPALDRRGGTSRVCHQTGGRGRPADLVFDVETSALNQGETKYHLELRVLRGGTVGVVSEKVESFLDGSPLPGEDAVIFDRTEQLITRGKSAPGMPHGLQPDQLFLSRCGSDANVNGLWRALTFLQAYNIVPDRFRHPTEDSPLRRLARDGSNVAWILAQLKRTCPQALERMAHHLAGTLDGAASVSSKLVGGRRVAVVRRRTAKGIQDLESTQCSDGTLRVLGCLTALFQDPHLMVVGLEEPETAIHPGALAGIVEAIAEVLDRSQVVVSTHSPELLDSEGVDVESIRLVQWDGSTTVRKVSKETIQVVRDRLSAPGRLLRANALVAASDEDRE